MESHSIRLSGTEFQNHQSGIHMSRAMNMSGAIGEEKDPADTYVPGAVEVAADTSGVGGLVGDGVETAAGQSEAVYGRSSCPR